MRPNARWSGKEETYSMLYHLCVCFLGLVGLVGLVREDLQENDDEGWNSVGVDDITPQCCSGHVGVIKRFLQPE